MSSQYKKNKERFPNDHCQCCGTLQSEDDGLMCNQCKFDLHNKGIDWKDWLEEYDVTRNPAYDGDMGIFAD